MEDNSVQSRGNNRELTQVAADMDMETEYLQDVTSLDESLDQSIDSLQGSLTLPSFTMEQSDELQGSQGFQVLNKAAGQWVTGRQESRVEIGQWVTSTASQQEFRVDAQSVLSRGNDVNSSSSRQCLEKHFSSDNMEQSGISDPSQQRECVERVYPTAGVLNVGVGGGVGEIGSLSSVGGSIIFTTAESGQVICRRDIIGDRQTDKQEKLHSEGKGDSHVGDGKGDGSGLSGDDKSAPKRRSKKPRSTSSLANEPSSRTEPSASGRSPSRSEGMELQGGSELGLKPSLFDEILTEKKMALLKSPEVIQFLQAQQRQLMKDSSTHGHDVDP